jgi:asparagine synthase (glutamine-hydrolysing)
VTDELDFIGPIAQESLRRHGVLYPTNAFFLLPLLRHARGGTLLTGLDGDSLLRTWRWVRAASVLAGRVRPTPRDVLRIGMALAPLRMRAWRAAQRERLDLPWLRAEALELVRRRFYTDLAAEPFAWPERIRWFSRRRALALTGDSLDRLARDSGAAIAHPLVDSRFLAILARAGGRFGFGDLTSIMRIHFGSLLPSAAIQRSDKATFGEVFWGPHSRKLAKLWRGRPIPCELVDARGLDDAWQEPQPKVESAALLQALSLASEGQHEASRESRDLVG